MSKTVDQKVVEMRFDNQQFEQNVKTSMSTLDKLKQSLNLTGASKNLEQVSSAAKNFNLSGINSAVETARSSFSALEVMGITALANLTNSAVEAGTRMTKALTIEPVMTGFQEYETQINSIQTILANTESKGSTLDDVNGALDELNLYADKTIYNFTEMTKNIGRFTAAGVDLDKSVSSIKGIANLAAVSGSTSLQASTAMYQLSQALASGTVKLMDWNSVVNAGMGGEVFQNALKRTATQMGYNVDELIKKYGSFRDSLSKGDWLTADVLSETLTQLSGAYTEADLIAQGYTEQQAKDIVKLADAAVGAATEVKTFSQLWDTMKESAQSGWAQTWEIVVGDFYEAKKLLTGISKFFEKFISKSANARNDLLTQAFGSKWDKFIKKVNDAGIKTEDFQKKLEEVARAEGIDADGLVKEFGSLGRAFSKGKLSGDVLVKTLKKFLGIETEVKKNTKELGDVVDKVINGDFGNGEERVKALTKAGYDYATVQNKVNEKLGCSFRYTSALTDAQLENADSLADMSNEQLKQEGYTKKQIKAIRELASAADESGSSIHELLYGKEEQKTGRELVIESLSNAVKYLGSIFKKIGASWNMVFPPKTAEEKGAIIYGMATSLHKFSNKLIMSKESAENLRWTFQGLFSILKLVYTITGGGLRIALKLLSELLGGVDLNILSVTGAIGKAAVNMEKFITENNLIVKTFKRLMPHLKEAADAIKDFVNSLVHSDIAKNILDGLTNGLQDGVFKIVDIMVNLGIMILDTIKNILGIHSPSVEFFEIGKNIIEGLVNGVRAGLSSVKETISSIGSTIMGVISKIDFGKIFAGAIGVGMLVVASKLIKVLGMFGSFVDRIGQSVGHMLRGIGNMFDGIGKYFQSKALKEKSKAILNIAIAIGILAGSVFILAQLDTGKLWASIGALAALAAIVVGLSFAISKMGSIDFRFVSKQAFVILGVAAALLILSFAMKNLSEIQFTSGLIAIGLLGGMIAGLAGVMFAFGKFVSKHQAAQMDKAGIMMLKMSVALLIMTFAIKQISKLEPDEIAKGITTVLLLETMFVAMVFVSKFAGKHADKAGSMMLKMSAALLIMTFVIKRIGDLDAGSIVKATYVIAAIEVLFAGIIFVSKFAGEHAAKAGTMMLLMSGALLIMTFVIKQIGELDAGALIKGLVAITWLEITFIALIAASQMAGKNAVKAGVMLLAMAASLAILTGVLFVLSKIDGGGLAKALGVVTVLELLFGGLIAVSYLARDVKGTLMAISVAIGILTLSIIALSFIDGRSLAAATGALASVMIAFGLIVAATKYAKASKNMIKTLGMLLGVIVVLAVIVGVLSHIGAEDALGASASIAILMTSMAATMAVMGKVHHVSKSATIAMVSMLGIVAGLAVILGLLTYFNVAPAMETVAAISILLVTMTAALAVLKFVGAGALAGVGALALMGLVVGELALILGLMTHFNVQPSIDTAIALSILLGAMSAALVILGVVGLMGPAAFIGIGALAVLVTGMGAVLIALGALATYVPKVKEFIDSGIPILEKIGFALGSFVGNLISGLGKGLTDGLPAIGNNLSLFMTNAQPFIEGIKMVDDTAIAGAKALSQAIIALCTAEFITSVSEFLSKGSSSLPQLGTDLSSFAENAAPFFEGIKNIDPASMQGVKALAEAVMTLTKEELLDGLTSWGSKESSLVTFGKELAEFAPYLKTYADEVAGIKDLDSLKASANAAKALAQMAEAIPNGGGIWGEIFGDNDMSTFGAQLVEFGKSLKSYSQAVVDLNADAVNNSVSAAKKIIELAKDIPNNGGIWGEIFGDNDMSTFGAQLVMFGSSLALYSQTVTNVDQDSVANSVKAAKKIVKLAEDIPEGGGWIRKITGNDDLDTFGERMVPFGKSLKTYSEAVADISTEKISSSVTTTKSLISMVKAMKGVSTKAAKSFKKAIDTLSDTDVEGFVSAFSGVTSEMTSAGVNVVSAVINGIKTKSSSLTTAGGTVATSLSKAISSKKSLFTTAGVEIYNNLIKGMNSKKVQLKNTLHNMLKNILEQLRTSYDSFYSMGSYMVTGFSNGIRNNTYKAKARARAMASAAAEAAKNELQVHSPSRVFYSIGDYAGLGFVNALDDYAVKAYKSSSDMASSAKKGLSEAISNISKIIDGSMDTQPTIRPVLDLSDIESGAGVISSMFGGNTNVLASVGSISSMMNNQNGTKNDVVSAINDLRKDLGGLSMNNYTINGVTYDDGSNISNAVKSLVRAARVERRI